MGCHCLLLAEILLHSIWQSTINVLSCFLASISLVIFLISDFTSNSPGLLLTRIVFSMTEYSKVEASTYSVFIVSHCKKLESLCFHPGSKHSLYHQTSVNFSHNFSKCEIMCTNIRISNNAP